MSAGTTTDWEVRLRSAVAKANIPTLVMVLYQLTGDHRWLEAPYAPTRPRGLDDHDTGGLPDDVQATIRDAALQAIAAHMDGAPAAVPNPRGEALVEMMSVCVGEPVPEEYEPMIAADLGFADADTAVDQRRDAADHGHARTDVRVVVIGAGIGGLLAALRLRERGIPHVVLERNADLGGTWFENRYPGAGVDTPSYLYSFSFFPQRWSRYFPARDEVLRNLNEFADHFGLRDSISFGTEVLSAVYDEARQGWTLRVRDGAGAESTMEATAVVSAVGLFSRPYVPDIPGMETFRGPIFHSARWPGDLDLTGKRVAVVGSGASAMQIVPAIADRVAELTIFQRSPMWIAPAEQYFRPVPAEVHWLLEHVPYYQRWYRFRLAWMFNDKVYPTLIKDPDWPHADRSLNAENDRHRDGLTRYLRSALDGRDDLIDKALPSYPPYGKRMLLDNGWFSALKRPNVELVDEPCEAITASTVRTATMEREVDVVVLCTGFDTQRFLAPIDFVGRGGRPLREDWGDDDARAYLGITVPGYPNLFMIYGPNTNGAGGSYLSFAESQVGYIVQLVEALADGRAGAVEPRADTYEAYNRRVDDQHARMVWTHPGMTTYYRNSRGRVVVNRPWSVLEYWELTRHVHFDDYVLEPVAGEASTPPV